MKDLPNEMRLQKFLSRAGIFSRRKAEEMIRQGRVAINGVTVQRMGVKVKAGDVVLVDGKPIAMDENYRYLVVYKPRGYVTTMKDPQGRPTVAELVAAFPERLYPVGRLDYDSEGLLLMTNDGDFALKVQHPRYQVRKIYRVKVKGLLSPEQVMKLARGVYLKDGFFKPEEVRIERALFRNTWLVIALREGRNRVIRRALKLLGIEVIRLIRVGIGNLALGNMKPGAYRELRKEEISELLS